MNKLHKLVLVSIPLFALAACGGDVADRLDVADPVVRFVHASSIAPNLTLYRAAAAQADATNVAYPFASNYFDVDMGASDWIVKTSAGGVTLGTVPIDPVRGNRYTIVALPASSVDSSTYLIVDPYNKPLGSSSSHLRLMNASFNASNIDLYMTGIGASITAPGANPLIAATAYKTSGPASGNDSVDIGAGTWQVTITTAGTKTILFNGFVTIADNQDVLLLTVPSTVTPGAINTLVKIDGVAGATEVPVI
ncbi:MAG: DUF4397 domain-containing protein [Burkholderiales bacterium]